MSLQDIADCMKGGLQPDADPDTIYDFKQACFRAATDMKIDIFIDTGVSTFQIGMIVRGAVMDRISAIAEMSRVALGRGFLLPDNPFVQLEKINRYRRLFGDLNIMSGKWLAMEKAAAQLSEITALYNDGKITFERKPAYQLSSYEVSVDGLSPQSGDPLTDILGYQPDGDFIKRKRALDSLSKLDFSKRQPYWMFTADFDGAALLCWSKMHDASGYKISRRDVFAMVDLPPVYLENQSLIDSTKQLMADDRFYQLLTFYDWLDHSDVFVYLDRSVPADTLYSFNVTGVQKKAPGSPFIFDVPTTTLFFSPALAQQVQANVEQEAEQFGRSPHTISPYPALARAVFGDPSYGWILAGLNTVAAVRRGDDADSVRALTFLGSTIDGILAAGKSGRLVIPQDTGSVSKNVDDSISAYGVSQTIVSLLDGLGVTEFISGKDDPTGTPTQESIERTTSGLARILAVIDPVTATLDTGLLVTTLSNQAQKLDAKASFIKEISSYSFGVPIDQVVTKETLDLTTHEGVSKLLQVLRTLYDFYPGTVS